MLPDTTCIEQDDIGILAACDRLVASLEEGRRDKFAVQFIHLTANGFNKKTLFHHAICASKESDVAIEDSEVGDARCFQPK